MKKKVYFSARELTINCLRIAMDDYCDCLYYMVNDEQTKQCKIAVEILERVLNHVFDIED